jgi:hypothetical protein
MPARPEKVFPYKVFRFNGWGWERIKSFKDYQKAVDYVNEKPNVRVLFVRADKFQAALGV